MRNPSVFCVVLGLVFASFIDTSFAHDSDVIHHGSFVVPEADEPTAFVVDNSEIKNAGHGPIKSKFSNQKMGSSNYGGKSHKVGGNYRNSYQPKSSNKFSTGYSIKESYTMYGKNGIIHKGVFEEPDHIVHIDKTKGYGPGIVHNVYEHHVKVPEKESFYAAGDKLGSSYSAKPKIPLPRGMPGVGSFKVFGGVYSSPLKGYSAPYGSSNNFGYKGFGGDYWPQNDFKSYGSYGYGPASFEGYGFGPANYGPGFYAPPYYGPSFYGPANYGPFGYEQMGYGDFGKGPMNYNNNYYNGDYDSYYKTHLSYGPIEQW